MNQGWTKNFIGVDELGEHLADPNWIVVDCRFNLLQPDAGIEAYRAGHIPGAVYANLDRDLAAPVAADGAGGRHPLPDPSGFARLLSGWGVGSESVVIAYDDIGNAIAARLWWLLRWLGHARVAVLDGGLDAWSDSGGPLTTDIPKPVPAVFEPRPGSMPVIDAEGIEARLPVDECVLLDARDQKRFNGQNEPIDSRAGHIPGAVNAPFMDNLGADKCFRPPAEIDAYYREKLGGRPVEMVACMCGSGVTACHTLLALETAGMHGASLYTGSWSDWISSGTRPVAAS